MSSFYILTNGCPETRIDSAVVEQMFLANGWTKASMYKEADLVLYNVCGQTALLPTEAKINILKRNIKRRSKLFVYGCYSKIGPRDALKRLEISRIGSDDYTAIGRHFDLPQTDVQLKANYLVPAQRFSTFEKVIGSGFLNPLNILELESKAYDHLLLRSIRNSGRCRNFLNDEAFIIKISTGCTGNCTYCSIRHARGRLVSQPVATILDQFQRGLDLGFQKFFLIGTNTALYGKDMQTNLADLLKSMVVKGGNFEVGLRNLNPRFFSPMAADFMDVLRSGRITYIESAVQSGSNRILESMNRGYTVEDYKCAIKRIRETAPDLNVRTQIIVNFPGETQEDIQATIDLIDEMKFDMIELYNYRPEPGTPASKFPRTISNREARKRYHKMLLKIRQTIKRNHSA